MANPVLSEKVFNKAHSEESTEVMTVKGMEQSREMRKRNKN